MNDWTDKTPMEQILYTAESIPISSDPRWSDIVAKDTALNKISDIARAELFPAETQAAPVEMNGDGDTLEELNAAKKQGRGFVEMLQITGRPRVPVHKDSVLDHPLGCYRITAKHADRFDAECMSFAVWARAAIGRGMRLYCPVEVLSSNSFDRIKYNGSGIWGEGINNVGFCWEAAISFSPWTAIPPAAAPAGEGPKGAKACGETLPLGAGTHDDPRPHHCLLPAGHEGRHFCHICGIYWDSVEPPPAKDAPTLRDVAKMAAALNTGQDCDPAHHTLVIAAMDALHGPPKPAMDWQAALQHIVIDAERALCNGSTLNRDGANVIHCLKDRAKTALQQAGIAGAKGGTE